MKVLQLLPALEQGGVESVVVALNRMLAAAGHTSVVASRGGGLVTAIERDGGRHIALELKSKNPLTYFSRMLALRRLLKAERPDLVCVHSRVPAWLFAGANRPLHLKWIAYAHGANRVSSYSAVMTRGDRIVTPSQYLADYLRANYRFDEARLQVIANPVREDRFDPARLPHAAAAKKRAAWGVAPDAPVVMALGRITPLKGFDILIRAFAKVSPRFPAARLVIVGGADRDKQQFLGELRTLAATLGVGERVVLAGMDPDAPACLAAATVVVSSNVAKPETFGLSLVEAALMNRPVIAKGFGGAREVVEADVTGLLLDMDGGTEAASASTQFAAAIERVLSGEWQPASDLRERTLRRFNTARFAEATLALYEQVRRS